MMSCWIQYNSVSLLFFFTYYFFYYLFILTYHPLSMEFRHLLPCTVMPQSIAV